MAAIAEIQKKSRIHINEFQKGQIKSLHLQGLSMSMISNELEMSKSTVGGILKRFQNRQNFSRKSGSGRKRIYSNVEAESIVKEVKKAPFISVKQVRNLCNVNRLSHTTVRRIIRAGCGFRSYRAVCKPFISEINQKKRYEWAKAHITWTVEDWSKVIWTDESPFVLRHAFQKHVWRKSGEAYKKQHLTTCVKHQKKINVWGAFSAHKVGMLHRIEGIMDQHVFNTILHNVAMPTIDMLFPAQSEEDDRQNFIFQQDNDPKHTARPNRQWLIDNNIRTFNWPSNSPDLNPIENLWSILDRTLHNRTPNNEADLFLMLQEAWFNIPIDTLQSLVASMPRRYQAVIDSKGGATKY